nr:hypothetical protein [Tanacetum cinerariifolium]
VFNQGRNIVDMDEGIELVVDQEKDAEVFSMQEDDTEVQEAIEVVTTTKLITKVVTAVATQIAAAPAVSTRRRKGVVIRDPKEELHTDTLAETPTVKDKGKGILIEDPKPMKKKDQVEMDAEIKKKPQSESEARKNMISYLKNTEGEEMEKEDEEIIKSINETPAQKAAKKRKMSEEAQEADDL